MRDIEDECTPEMIIKCREEALNKLAALLKEENGADDVELEQKIQKEVKKQV